MNTRHKWALIFSAMAFTALVVRAQDTTGTFDAGHGTANVVTLGADPAGEKDSTAAFQNALDAGGTVIVPHGTYLLTKTLRINKSGTSVIGQPRAVLRFPEGFPESGLVAKAEPFGMRDIVLRDLVLDCDKSNYTPGKDGKYACGITVFGVDGAVVENCTVNWFTFTGICVAASKNVRVSRCATLGGRHGIGVNGHIGNPAKNGAPYGCWFTSISDCRIRETWDTFIPVGLCASHVTISGCVCDGSAAHGFDIFNSDHVVVTGNTLNNWMDPRVPGGTGEQAVGIFVHSDWGVSLDIPTRDIVISGNVLTRDEYPPSVRPVGISVAGAVDGVVVANNMVAGGNTGFAATDVAGKEKRYSPRNLAVTGNVFKGQRLSLWIDSTAPMPALVSLNLFDLDSDGDIAHFGEKTQGVTFTGNTITRGKLPQLPAGVTWEPGGGKKMIETVGRL